MVVVVVILVVVVVWMQSVARACTIVVSNVVYVFPLFYFCARCAAEMKTSALK